jgi:uncharacterized membrane protein YeaQ/YmgE (transglycosylase-associated protein family)
VTITLFILLLLGYGTFLRVIVRNAESDRYKRRLSRIRQYFLQNVDDPHRHFTAFSPFEHAWRKPASWRRFGRGGWLETMAAVEAIVGGVLGAWAATWLGEAWLSKLPILHAFTVRLLAGLIAGAAVWYWLIKRANALYVSEMSKQRIGVGYEP